MDLFNSNVDDVALTTPEFNTAQQTEYSKLQDVDFTNSLEDKKPAEKLQNKPAPSASIHAFVDPQLIALRDQQPNDFSNSSIYNNISVPDPNNEGMYNAGNLVGDPWYQFMNGPQQNGYQQNGFQPTYLQPGPSQMTPLQQQIAFHTSALENITLQQNTFPQNPYQQGNFQQSFNQPGLTLQAPQPMTPSQPQFVKQGKQDLIDLITPPSSYLGDQHDYVYRNKILRRFEEPAVALRVIDQIMYPLHPEIQATLEKEAFHQEDLKIAKEIKSEFETETMPNLYGRKKHGNYSKRAKSPEKGKTPAKPAKNDRAQNRLEVLAHAKKVYKDIPSRPAPWGTINPETGAPTFEYTRYGELALGQRYTLEQMIEYLAHHPLHGKLPGGDADTKKSALKLWIQYVPADSNLRYPDPHQSNKCRFIDCARKNQALYKGEPRICFDEQRFPGYPKNPFHNAGYVHLYCMEKLLDFPRLCRDFNVSPDTRALNEKENRMAITKSTRTMEGVVNDWIEASLSGQRFEVEHKGFEGQGTRRDDWFNKSLTYCISEHHMATQSLQVQKKREKRGGNTVDLYMGNLDLWAENDAKIRAHKDAHPRVPKRKRKLDTAEEEQEEQDEQDEDAEGESESDEDILDEEILSRPTKRPRRS